MALKIFLDPRCGGHRGYFPLAERPARLDALADLFAALGHSVHAAPPATREMLEAAHDPAYVAHVAASSRRRIAGQLGDFAASLASPYLQWYLRPMAGTWEAATRAAGAVCQAVDEAAASPRYRAFCAVRPPGHHAGPARGEGFCFFNNVAVGALRAAGRGLRVAIVDFDHHHGNGTQAVVESRGRGDVLLVSSHYAGCKYARRSGAPARSSEVVAIPVPAGSRMAEVGALYRARAIPALRAFQPDLLMISAGFDMHKDDPLSSIRMESADYFELTRMLVDAAAETGCDRVVSVLEGGYRGEALREGVAHHLRALEQ
jgi:acetoin utilization deacetylase AcuC-like enzyme